MRPRRGSELEEKVGGIEGGGGAAQRSGLARPGMPEGGVVGEGGLNRGEDGSLVEGDGAGAGFEDEAGIAFFLAWDDVVNDHRTTSGEGFLHGSAAGFADEKMRGAKKTRHFLAPTDDVERAKSEVSRMLDGLAEAAFAADGDGQLNAPEGGKAENKLGRDATPGVDEIEDAAGVVARRGALGGGLGELGADRETEGADFFLRDAIGAQDGGAAVVREEEVIGAAAEPDGVDGDGIGDDDDALRAATIDRPEHFIEHVGVGGIDGDDDVGLEVSKETAEALLEGEEDVEAAFEFVLPVEPAIDAGPGAGPLVNDVEIDFAREGVGRAVGLGEKVVDLGADIAPGDNEEGLSQGASGAVMALAEAGGEDEDLFQTGR